MLLSCMEIFSQFYMYCFLSQEQEGVEQPVIVKDITLSEYEKVIEALKRAKAELEAQNEKLKSELQSREVNILIRTRIIFVFEKFYLKSTQRYLLSK